MLYCFEIPKSEVGGRKSEEPEFHGRYCSFELSILRPSVEFSYAFRISASSDFIRPTSYFGAEGPIREI
jgi:hypothetical protein